MSILFLYHLYSLHLFLSQFVPTSLFFSASVTTILRRPTGMGGHKKYYDYLAPQQWWESPLSTAISYTHLLLRLLPSLMKNPLPTIVIFCQPIPMMVLSENNYYLFIRPPRSVTYNNSQPTNPSSYLNPIPYHTPSLHVFRQDCH